MSTSPQENLIPPSRADSESTLADDGSVVEGLVEDVLREARSLLGEAALVDADVEENVDSAEGPGDRFSGDGETTGAHSNLDVGLQEDGIKRGPTARDLGTEGPQVDLFGMATPSEAPTAPAGLPTEYAEHGRQESMPPNAEKPEADGASPEASSPAAALEALMERRIAQESEVDDPVASPTDVTACAVETSEITRAEAAERAAMASLDAMGGSTPLRSTAGEVEAVSSGDPLVQEDLDTPSIDPITPASTGSAIPAPVIAEPTPSAKTDDAESRLDPPPASESPSASTEIGDESASNPPSSEDDSTMTVESPAAPAAVQKSPVIIRLAALPFRMLPSSVHGLVSVAAISIVFWIPVAWTYAILGPEAFERLLPSAAAPADTDTSIEPTTPTEAPDVDSSGSDPAGS